MPAEADAKQLHLPGATSPTDVVVGKLTQQSGGGASYCYRCDGTDHNHTKCGFKTSRCHFCKKLGHIAAACHQRKGGTRKPWSGQGKRVKTLGGAEEDPESAGADLGGGSTRFVRAPFSSDLLASKNRWRRFPLLQNSS